MHKPTQPHYENINMHSRAHRDIGDMAQCDENTPPRQEYFTPRHIVKREEGACNSGSGKSRRLRPGTSSSRIAIGNRQVSSSTHRERPHRRGCVRVEAWVRLEAARHACQLRATQPMRQAICQPNTSRMRATIGDGTSYCVAARRGSGQRCPWSNGDKTERLLAWLGLSPWHHNVEDGDHDTRDHGTRGPWRFSRGNP